VLTIDEWEVLAMGLRTSLEELLAAGRRRL
jgi:hypothetical protein